MKSNLKIQHNHVEQLEHTTFFTFCADLSQYRNLFVTATGTARSLYFIAVIEFIELQKP